MAGEGRLVPRDPASAEHHEGPEHTSPGPSPHLEALEGDEMRSTRPCDWCRTRYVFHRSTSRYCCGTCQKAARRAGKDGRPQRVSVAWFSNLSV